jgi:hypothetical protein
MTGRYLQALCSIWQPSQASDSLPSSTSLGLVPPLRVTCSLAVNFQCRWDTIIIWSKRHWRACCPRDASISVRHWRQKHNRKGQPPPRHDRYCSFRTHPLHNSSKNLMAALSAMITLVYMETEKVVATVLWATSTHKRHEGHVSNAAHRCFFCIVPFFVSAHLWHGKHSFMYMYINFLKWCTPWNFRDARYNGTLPAIFDSSECPLSINNHPGTFFKSSRT